MGKKNAKKRFKRRLETAEMEIDRLLLSDSAADHRIEELEEEAEVSLEIIHSKCDQIANLQATNTVLRDAAELERKKARTRLDKHERNASALRANVSCLLGGHQKTSDIIAEQATEIKKLRETIRIGSALDAITIRREEGISGETLQTKAFEDPESPERKKEGKTRCNRTRLRLLFQTIVNFTRTNCWVGGRGDGQPGGSDSREG